MRGRQHPFDSVEQFFEQMRREMMTEWGASALEATEHETTPESAQRDTAPEMTQYEPVAHTHRGGWDTGITVEETDDGFVVVADLPGFDREELTVSLHEAVLHLSGEHEVGEGVEYRSRRVSEQIRLPTRVAPEHVTASYNNGVLEVAFAVDDDTDAGARIEIE